MAGAMGVAGELPRPMPRAVLCPYCGGVTAQTGRCTACGGRFDPLSRQATQNHMGPWAIRDDRAPHRPGCTYETLCRLIDAGSVGLDSVVRGPSTRQFWTLARHTPGVSHRLGVCHNCREPVARDAFQCPSCHAPFTVDRDRQHLGVGPFRPLPGQGTPEVMALHAGPARSAGVEPKDFTRVTTGADGNASAGMGGATEEQIRAAGRAQTAATTWRRHSEQERSRGLVALVLAALVVLTSLLYAGLVSSGPTRGAPVEEPPREAGG
jgi:hypothetical protein|tara:strand:- start:5044 stop:5841 length:798 start_codon:yes stop_codon:yes gene_type:complete